MSTQAATAWTPVAALPTRITQVGKRNEFYTDAGNCRMRLSSLDVHRVTRLFITLDAAKQKHRILPIENRA